MCISIKDVAKATGVPMCISIKDVAKATGVSYSIVSPALSDSPPLKRISIRRLRFNGDFPAEAGPPTSLCNVKLGKSC